MIGNQEGGSLISVWAAGAPRLLMSLHQSETIAARIIRHCALVVGAADEDFLSPFKRPPENVQDKLAKLCSKLCFVLLLLQGCSPYERKTGPFLLPDFAEVEGACVQRG